MDNPDERKRNNGLDWVSWAVSKEEGNAEERRREERKRGEDKIGVFMARQGAIREELSAGKQTLYSKTEVSSS